MSPKSHYRDLRHCFTAFFMLIQQAHTSNVALLHSKCSPVALQMDYICYAKGLPLECKRTTFTTK